MSVYKNILERRTIRRFQPRPVPYKILERCVNAGRMAPSGANLQPWEFIIVDDKNKAQNVFPTLAWAGYLENGAPPKGQEPMAYIVILLNKEIRPRGGHHDTGMAAQNIMLTAHEEGLGSCCIGSVQRNRLRAILNIPETREIDLVIALGYPAEKSKAEKARESIKYWKDDEGILHVPKRCLKDLVHRNSY